jgi:lysozyme family protein
MAKGTFDAAFRLVLKHEGGYVDHPSDPGGATMKGVTLATFRRYRPNATKADLRAISDAMLQKIYRDGYWNEVRGDDLPAGVDFATFDFAVNSGPARATIYLQNIVGAAPDGEIGPLTIKAVKAYCDQFGAGQMVNELCSQRLAFLERLSTWPVFGKGWRSRVADVRKLALSMASAPGKPLPIDLPDDPEPAAPQKRKTLVDLLRGFFVRQATAHVVSTLKENGMNTNLFHNLLNVAIALLAGVTAFLLATGCTQLVTGALDCSASWIDPVWTTGITAALGLLKTVINIFRDGIGGLFKQQPPVR